VSGTQGDEFVSQDGDNWDGNWDPVWEHETLIDAEGWTAEVRIPMSQLRYEDQLDQVWGIQVMRRIYRAEERSVWQPIPKDQDGWVSKFGELRGISGLRPQRRLEVLPYMLAKGETFETIDGDPFTDGSAGQFTGGLDAKVGVGSDLTMDLTVNPDFGQVEADPSEVNLTAFETFFPEKRPFFVEGANIFEFRLAPSVAFGTHTTDRLFYSRRIGREPHYRADFNELGFVDQPENSSILGAAKLTGKAGGMSVGVMESITAEETAEVRLDGVNRDVTVEPLTSFFVGRAQKDYRKGDTRIGGMVTATNRDIDAPEVEFLHESAYAGGVDFFHYTGGRKYYLAANVLGSHVAGSELALYRTQTAPARYYQRPDNKGQSLDTTRTSLSGHGGSVRIGKSSGKLNADGGVAWRSPGFELNDMGFMRNADEINQFAWVGYSIRNPFSIFRRMSFNTNQWLDFEYGGENTYQAFNFNTSAGFRNNWSYNASITRENERISVSELRGGPSMKLPGNVNVNGGIDTDSRRRISGGIGGNTTILDDEAGESSGIWTYLAWRPNNAIRVEVNPEYSRYRPDLQYMQTTEDTAGQPAYVFGDLDQETFDVSLRLDYSITPRLTVQYYGMPFVSAGKYGDFKRVTSPRAGSYEERFVRVGDTATQNPDDGNWSVDENGDGTAEYSFFDQDFNVRDFNSNLVVRWEYSPGSSVYLVWSQSRTGFVPDGTFEVRNDLDSLFDVHPHNVFLIKINRWFDL
jgi:hypothetical protein